MAVCSNIPDQFTTLPDYLQSLRCPYMQLQLQAKTGTFTGAQQRTPPTYSIFLSTVSRSTRRQSLEVQKRDSFRCFSVPSIEHAMQSSCTESLLRLTVAFLPLTNIHRLQTQLDMRHGWWQAETHLEGEAYKLYGTVHTVFIKAVHSHVPARSAARQIFSGELQAGGEQHMFMFDWSALMTPQKATLDSLHNFRDSYPIDFSHPISTFSVYCHSRYLSRWSLPICSVPQISPSSTAFLPFLGSHLDPGVHSG